MRQIRYPAAELDRLFAAADSLWEQGKLRAALRKFQQAAEKGDAGAALNVGYFYDEGVGIRPDKERALYWYRRSHRAGCAEAATSIGLVLKAQKDLRGARRWLLRALREGDHDAALDLARICLESQRGRDAAIRFLQLALRSKNVTPATLEEADRILRKVTAPPPSGIDSGTRRSRGSRTRSPIRSSR
jgi:TPR repeat protein